MIDNTPENETVDINLKTDVGHLIGLGLRHARLDHFNPANFPASHARTVNMYRRAAELLPGGLALNLLLMSLDMACRDLPESCATAGEAILDELELIAEGGGELGRLEILEFLEAHGRPEPLARAEARDQ